MLISGAWLAVLSMLFINLASSVKYVPERSEITYLDEHFVTNASVYISRYGRRSPYYYNICGTTKHTWGNNITVHVLFYEYHNNKFKRTFVEFHLKLCDWIQRDPTFGKAFGIILSRYGIKCPVAPGQYELRNLTMPTEHMPNVLPFNKGKSEVTVYRLPAQEVIIRLYIIFHVQQ